MPSSEEWAHVLEVVKSTGDEQAISTLTSLIVVHVNPPKEENSPKEGASVEPKEGNSPKEEAPVEPKEEAPAEAKEENSGDKMDDVYDKILAKAEASGDSGQVASVKRAYDFTPDSDEERAKKLLKMSDTNPVMAAMLAGLDKQSKRLQALM